MDKLYQKKPLILKSTNFIPSFHDEYDTQLFLVYPSHQQLRSNIFHFGRPVIEHGKTRDACLSYEN